MAKLSQRLTYGFLRDNGTKAMNHKITIGVCVRNCEATVGEAINSILDQDYSHELMEVIFVDDGSKDGTLGAILNSLPRLKMHVKVFHHEWKGLGFSRNLVVDNASGEYIVWLDGDMVLSKDYVRKLVQLMDRNPKVGIAKGKYSLAPGANLIATLEIYSRAAGKMVDFNSRVKTCSMGTGGGIYRVKAIRQVGGFDENIKGYGEDWDAESRIRAAGWLLRIIEAQFRDYERRGLAWKDIWRKYLRRGYDSHYFFHKKKGIIKLYKWTPFAAFFSGLFHSLILYKLTHKEKVFLLPIQYTFKMTAWCLGFLKGYLHLRGGMDL